MTPDEVIAQARETAAGFTRLVAELERAQTQAALAEELQVEVDRLRATLAGSEVVRELADRVDRIGQLQAAIGRVRELHRRLPSPWGGEGECAACIGAYGDHLSYPCPTVQALEGGVMQEEWSPPGFVPARAHVLVQEEDARLQAEARRLRGESPYFTCRCGREVHVPALAEFNELRAMRERAERVRDLADAHPSYGKARGQAAREILGDT